MRFLYHIKHGGQLFEEDGTDHTKDGWFDHPTKAGLMPVIDPNGPTRWVAPANAPAPAPREPSTGPKAEVLWVPIPENWAALHWKQQTSLASHISGGEVETKPAAVAIIEAELERRRA